MGTIYLARHGRTEWNRDELIRGRADIPLDEFGRAQARAIGEALQGKGVDLVVSSPLARARETARVASSLLGTPPVLEEPGLVDIDYGEWQGKTHAQARANYPELYTAWLHTPSRVRFPGGESVRAAASRAWRAFTATAVRYAAQRLLVVTHRVVNKLILCRLLRAPLDSFWQIRQDTACLNVVDWDGSRFTLHRLNDTCHLRELGAPDRLDF